MGNLMLTVNSGMCRADDMVSWHGAGDWELCFELPMPEGEPSCPGWHHRQCSGALRFLFGHNRNLLQCCDQMAFCLAAWSLRTNQGQGISRQGVWTCEAAAKLIPCARQFDDGYKRENDSAADQSSTTWRDANNLMVFIWQRNPTWQVARIKLPCHQH